MGSQMSISQWLKFYDTNVNKTYSRSFDLDYSNQELTDQDLIELLQLNDDDLEIMDRYIKSGSDIDLFDLSNNKLQGNIPHFPCGAIRINKLDLSNNELTLVPYYLGNMMITYIDLSNNHLGGSQINECLPDSLFKRPFRDSTVDLSSQFEYGSKLSRNNIHHLPIYCPSKECTVCKEKVRSTLTIIVSSAEFIKYRTHNYIHIFEKRENGEIYNAGVWTRDERSDKYYSPLIKSIKINE